MLGLKLNHVSKRGYWCALGCYDYMAALTEFVWPFTDILQVCQAGLRSIASKIPARGAQLSIQEGEIYMRVAGTELDLGYICHSCSVRSIMLYLVVSKRGCHEDEISLGYIITAKV